MEDEIEQIRAAALEATGIAAGGAARYIVAPCRMMPRIIMLPRSASSP